MTGYIYIIRNKINSKSYIGQTITSVDTRANRHFSKHSNCKRLASAVKKYGKNYFTVETVAIIESNTRDKLINDLNQAEKALITHLNTIQPFGYNLTTGGDRTVKDKESVRLGAEKHWKPVFCVETGQEWPSVKACAEYFKVKPKQVSRALKGQRKRLSAPSLWPIQGNL